MDKKYSIIGTLVDVVGFNEEASEELCYIYKTLVICFGLNWEWKPTANFLDKEKNKLVIAISLKEQMWCVQ
jgi:hypothetical protein